MPTKPPSKRAIIYLLIYSDRQRLPSFSLQAVNLYCILGYWPWESVTQWRQLLENLLDAFVGQVKPS